MMVDGPELAKCAANFVPLSPISFLKRADSFFGPRTAGAPSIAPVNRRRDCQQAYGAKHI